MSGLYNMLMGVNPTTGILLQILNLEPKNLGRFRDTYISEDGKFIYVFTRNYGEEFEELDAEIALHPSFVRKFFEDTDETYSTYEFKVPEQMLPVVQGVIPFSETVPCMTRYRQLIKDLEDKRSNKLVDRANEVGKKIVGAIMEELEEKQPTGEVIEVSHDGSSVLVKTILPEEKP